MNLDQSKLTANPDQATSTFETVFSNLPQAPTQDQTDSLLTLLGNSNFLARWVRRFSETVGELLKEDWHQTWDEIAFSKALEKELKKSKTKDANQLASTLLDFKYRHLFRITLRDMALKKPFTEIAMELSSLAVALLKSGLHYFQTWCQAELGTSKTPIPFCILGMGKLGGMELNYSSDIDLIYFYGSDQGEFRLPKSKEPLSPHVYFTKLSERLTCFLNQKTDAGFLYRVDLELRPEGNNGALTNSLDAMEDYYESFGADWEKQAMIKAQGVAGSTELFQEFQKRIHPFVYPKVADYSFIQRMAELKARTLQSLESSSAQGYHVKLGKGGIREIEFFVQTHQFLFGGKIPELQTPNTLSALEILKKKNFLVEKDYQKLKQAYVFLRTLENRLQQVEEQQTHRLPESPEELDQMARRMGYKQQNAAEAREAMLKELNQHRALVERMFNQLLEKGS